MGLEKASVDNLKTSYDNLKDAIAQKYLTQLRESTVGNAETAKNDARAALNEFNAEFIRNTKISSGPNKGKVYNALGIGRIQGEVERFIEDHPLYGAMELYKALVEKYEKEGLALSDRQKGKLYSLAYQFSESSKILKKNQQQI